MASGRGMCWIEVWLVGGECVVYICTGERKKRLHVVDSWLSTPTYTVLINHTHL